MARRLSELEREDLGVLAFVAAVFVIAGARLAADPAHVAGAGPMAGFLFVAGALAVLAYPFALADVPRALAGALAAVAPASRSVILLTESIAHPEQVNGLGDALLGVLTWLLIAVFVLYLWTRLLPRPRR